MADDDRRSNCPKGSIPDEESDDAKRLPQSRNLYSLTGYADDEKSLELVQCRVDAVPELGRFTSLQTVCLRQNIISSINSNFGENLSTLVELDLNDNQISEIRGLEVLVSLSVLDLSYNRIDKIEGLSKLVNLTRLYLVHNKISVIEGLESATHLKLLELGDNRIKKLEALTHLAELEELYVGGNRIHKIENIERLTKLRVLSLAGNRLTKLEALEPFSDLEELHLSDQGLEQLNGVENLRKLKILDVANNRISQLGDTLAGHPALEDLWLNNNKISAWSEVDALSSLKSLRTVYLEMNPIQEEDRNSYRRKVIMALPQVNQVDAVVCR